MNVEIEAEASQFPEKKYLNGIAVAVCNQAMFHDSSCLQTKLWFIMIVQAWAAYRLCFMIVQVCS
jgi:hypothetical protein